MDDNKPAGENAVNELHHIQFAKRTFLLIASSILRIIAQLVIIILYARVLSNTDYGFYQSVWLYINVISVISLFGLPSLILSTSTKNIKEWLFANRKSFYLYAGLLNLVPFFYLLVIVDNFNLITKLLIILLIIIQNISIVKETICIKNEKEILVFITNIIHAALYFTWHVTVLCSNYSLQLLLTGLVFIFLFKVFVQWHFSKSISKDNNDTASLSITMQWCYLGLYDIAGVVSKWLDKWLILSLVSVSQFAIYFNGSYEIPVFGLMVGAVGNIMLIELSKKGTAITLSIKTLFYKSTSLLAAIVFPTFSFLFFYHADFFTLLFGPKYQGAIPIFLISIFVLPARITNSAAALQVYGRNDLIVKGAILDIITALVLMLILYPFFHLKGIALAFVIATYLQILYYLWHTGKLIGKKITYFFPLRKLSFMMALSFILSGAGYFILNKIIFPFNLITGFIVCLLLIAAFLYKYYTNYKFRL
jgi:O-antigen/teichoic acid export membrane protein